MSEEKQKRVCYACGGSGHNIAVGIALGLAIYHAPIPFPSICWTCHGTGKIDAT